MPSWEACTADAFAGHVDQLERLLGAAQASAVMNADLTFAMRLEGVAAPQRLRENLTIDTAVGLIAGIHRIYTEEADRSLRDDADRAGVHLVQAARVVVAASRRRR
jgi:AmiR/NasT family two-component response regulator